jgi:hypothetical protein
MSPCRNSLPLACLCTPLCLSFYITFAYLFTPVFLFACVISTSKYVLLYLHACLFMPPLSVFFALLCLPFAFPHLSLHHLHHILGCLFPPSCLPLYFCCLVIPPSCLFTPTYLFSCTHLSVFLCTHLPVFLCTHACLFCTPLPVFLLPSFACFFHHLACLFNSRCLSYYSSCLSFLLLPAFLFTFLIALFFYLPSFYYPLAVCLLPFVCFFTSPFAYLLTRPCLYFLHPLAYVFCTHACLFCLFCTPLPVFLLPPYACFFSP